MNLLHILYSHFENKKLHFQINLTEGGTKFDKANVVQAERVILKRPKFANITLIVFSRNHFMLKANQTNIFNLTSQEIGMSRLNI